VSRAAVGALVAEAAAGTPRHFRAVGHSLLEMSGGQRPAAFNSQLLALSRSRATAAVLEGTPWEGRPAAFDFVCGLHAAADPAGFGAAATAGLDAAAAQLMLMLEGGAGPWDEEEGEEAGGEGEDGDEVWAGGGRDQGYHE